jgi:cyclophilin family peptidyl-prolyl cis-trans isomerase/HEAT repeat protein
MRATIRHCRALACALGITLGAGAPLAAQSNVDSAWVAVLAAEDWRPRDVADRVRLEPIRAALASSDPRVRRLAVRAIGRLERPALILEIFPHLDSPDAGVRAEAATAIANASRALAGDSTQTAAQRLADVAEALGRRVATERDPAARGAFARSIGRLPYTSVADVAQARGRLLAMLDPSAAVDGGATTGEPTAVVLIETLRGLESLVRLQARRAPAPAATYARVAEIVRSPSVAARARRLAMSVLTAAGAADSAAVVTAAQSSDPQLRRLGISAATAAPAPWTRLTIERALGDPAPMVRVDAVRGYARLFAGAGCAPIRAATEDSSGHVALAAIDGLTGACADRADAVATLVRLAETGAHAEPGGRVTWHRGAHALVALAKVDAARAHPLIERGARAAVWQVRMYAAHAAGEVRDTTLLLRLAHDPVPNVAEAAVAELRRRVGHAADSVYIAALASADYQLLITAANALEGTAARAQAAPALRAALDRLTRGRRETSRDARMALLTRLAAMDMPEAAQALAGYRNDFDPAIAEAAARATAATDLASYATRRPGAAEASTPQAPELAALRTARLRVTMDAASGGGTFEITLVSDDAPASAARVTRLANRGYYDGLTFHRVVSNFVVQGGSPGANEYHGDGPFMRDELTERSHVRGTVGISTRGRDTGDAQLFVNLVDNPRLDHDYTIIGVVTAGMDVVDGILEGDRIARVTVLSPQSRR